MYIIKDYSYIKADEKLLIENGYGQLSVRSIHFDRHYSEEQKTENRRAAETMTSEEWSIHCAEIAESFRKVMSEILERFVETYDVHQATEETGTIAHYLSNWDLFFWSDRGMNGNDFMTRFSLSFNEHRSPEQNVKLLDEILSLVEAMEYDNVGCRILYEAVIDHKKVAEKAWEVYKGLAGKDFLFLGIPGKLKVVGESEGIREYGFFKKNARSRYYSVSDREILAMHLNH